MKTETVNVSLPKDLAEFIKQDMSVGAYETVNEYLRELIRQRRQARIQADVKVLEETLKGAPTTEPPQQFFDTVSRIQKRLRAQRRRRPSRSKVLFTAVIPSTLFMERPKPLGRIAS